MVGAPLFPGATTVTNRVEPHESPEDRSSPKLGLSWIGRIATDPPRPRCPPRPMSPDADLGRLAAPPRVVMRRRPGRRPDAPHAQRGIGQPVRRPEQGIEQDPPPPQPRRVAVDVIGPRIALGAISFDGVHVRPVATVMPKPDRVGTIDLHPGRGLPSRDRGRFRGRPATSPSPMQGEATGAPTTRPPAAESLHKTNPMTCRHPRQLRPCRRPGIPAAGRGCTPAGRSADGSPPRSIHETQPPGPAAKTRRYCPAWPERPPPTSP